MVGAGDIVSPAFLFKSITNSYAVALFSLSLMALPNPVSGTSSATIKSRPKASNSLIAAKRFLAASFRSPEALKTL